VFDSGDAEGRLWYTMPYVEGESLRDPLVRERQLPVEEAVRIVCEPAEALHYAHRQGIVHRDVKPENLLLTEDGTTLVADFGIARTLAGAGVEGATQLTGTGLAIGTPAYMTPSRRRRSRTSTRAPTCTRSARFAAGRLRFDTHFSAIRGDPRFERLIAAR